MGGKSRYGEEIAAMVQRTGQLIYEPFCGGLWVTQHLRPCVASDIHDDLIELYRAIRLGWEPPTYVTEEEYSECHWRATEGDVDEFVTFVGFAASWGGKWFGGYARGEVRNYVDEAARSLKTKVERCGTTEFQSLHYQNLDVKDAIIYCDPPYLHTTGYTSSEFFDSGSFWRWAEKEVMKGNTVYVSEFDAPSSWVSIKEFDHFDSLSSRRSLVDKLFKHMSQVTFEDSLFCI